MSLLPTSNNATGNESLTAFKLSDKIISITLFLLTPPFMVIMFAFCCIALAARGLLFGLLALISWEYASHATPSDAPSFWRTLLGTQQTVIIGGCMIGSLIGIILSATYISERRLPMGVRRLGPQRRLPYISSDVKKGTPWRYRGDSTIVVCMGLLLGSAAVPVAYCAMQQWGWVLEDVPEDPTRPILIGCLGALCSTVLEFKRGGDCQAAEEKKIADEVALATDHRIMASEKKMVGVKTAEV